MILRSVPLLLLGLAFSSAVQAEIYSCFSTKGQWFSNEGDPLPYNIDTKVFIVDTAKGIKTDLALATGRDSDEYFGNCQSGRMAGNGPNYFCHSQNQPIYSSPFSIFISDNYITGGEEIIFTASVLGIGPKFFAGKCTEI